MVEKINKILKELGETPNKDLISCLEYLTEQHEQTKNNIIQLTNHLDNIEITYNKILKEYDKRNNVK